MVLEKGCLSIKIGCIEYLWLDVVKELNFVMISFLHLEKIKFIFDILVQVELDNIHRVGMVSIATRVGCCKDRFNHVEVSQDIFLKKEDIFKFRFS